MAEEKPVEKKESKEIKKPRQPQPGQQEVKGNVSFTRAVPAVVEEIIGRTGSRGEATQVRCKILEGRDANKVLRRNIKGHIQLGDILMLRETEIEAKPLTNAGRGRAS
jgi:small subunit ribosomal protein S28e